MFINFRANCRVILHWSSLSSSELVPVRCAWFRRLPVCPDRRSGVSTIAFSNYVLLFLSLGEDLH